MNYENRSNLNGLSLDAPGSDPIRQKYGILPGSSAGGGNSAAPIRLGGGDSRESSVCVVLHGLRHWRVSRSVEEWAFAADHAALTVMSG